MNPIATNKAGFICFAFPDICKTQVGPAQVPIPYPNIGNLSDAIGFSTNVFADGSLVILQSSVIPITTGDEAGAIGSIGGDAPGSIKGKVEFPPPDSGSTNVFANGKPVIRMFDPTKQNNGNAAGQVLGGVPTVLVGG